MELTMPLRQAPVGAPQASGSSRRRDIQGLRAIAVGLVVAFHAGLPLPGGFTGVDVFFVISGFVITAMLQREWLATGRIRFRSFYVRRFRRLTPALALMITVVAAVSTLAVSPLGYQDLTAITGVAAMLLSANVLISAVTGGYFDPHADANPLLHTWSLSVEEQFYLLFPAVLLVIWRLSRRLGARWLPGVLVAAIAVSSFGYLIAGGGDPDDFYNTFMRVWEFAAGALLAVLVGRRRHEPVVSGRVLGGLGWAGVGMLGLTAVLVTDGIGYPGPQTLLPVVGTALVILAGSLGRGSVSRWLGHPVLVRVGDLSYSWYLWHWPLIVFAGNLWPGAMAARPVAAAVSLVPAVLSCRFLEQPFRLRWWGGRRSDARLVLIIMLTPLLACLLLVKAAGGGLGSPTILRDARDLATPHVSQAAGCNLEVRSEPWPGTDCVWRAGAPGRPVYLVGDSNAEHFSDAVVSAASALDRPVVVGTHGACPPLLTSIVDRGASAAWNDRCQHTRDRVIAWLDAAPAGVVVLASSDKYIDQSRYMIASGSASPATSPDAKAAVWQAALSRTVENLRSAGHQVVIVDTVPRWAGDAEWDPADCVAAVLLSDRPWCAATMPVADALARQHTGREAVQAVARKDGATVLDPWPSLCTETCSVAGPGFLRYRDGDHITTAQSLALAPDFEAVLRSLG